MESTLLIILIVVAVALLALSVIILILLLKRGTVEKTPSPESEEIKTLSANLQSLHNDVQNVTVGLATLKESIPLVISQKTAEQMASLQKSFAEQAEKDNQRMQLFQTSVTKSVNDQMALVNKTLTDNTAAMNKKVEDNFKDINDRVNKSLQDGFKGNSDTMGELKKQLGAIDDAQKHLQSLQDDVTSLNQVLQGNQTRGAYGELQLEMLLESTFPNGKGKYYNLQDDLGFTKGEEKVRPDADLIFTVNGTTSKLCIDSKFPFADYAKLFSGEKMEEADRNALKTRFSAEVKKKYKDIADKYIIPNLTPNYAIMFIPNDGVFAYIENEFPDLVGEARSLGVILACPSTLQAIVVVFHNAAMEAERSKNMAKMEEALKGLGTEFGRFAERWDSLQRSIQVAANKTTQMTTTVNKITGKFGKINSADLQEIDSDGDGEKDSWTPIEGPSDGTPDDK
jgi:DNA recombination protein RmuC